LSGDNARLRLGLLATDLDVEGALEGELSHAAADGALELEDDLLGGLHVLAEDGLGLTTETGLLPVVATLT